MDTDRHTLAPGTVLEHYRIERVLGEGGFGITYLAMDLKLEMRVVIKEYFPTELAVRGEHSQIHSRSHTREIYQRGLARFKEEAKILAKFNHPSIVRILSFFEANHTAYFVMEYEEGIDLAQYLQKKGTLSQEEVLSIMMPILEGLKEIHAHHYLHRDIKPGNILIRKNRSPVLIDFGASKQVIAEVSRSVTSMLTEGYAPLEQYSTDLKQQGPWTDLYAVGAVIYRMITGEVPPSAQTRSYQLLQEGNDPYRPLLELRPPGFDENFLRAVDRALALKARERPQNVQEFQADIAGELVRHNTRENTTPPPSEKKSRSKAPLALAAGLVVLLLGGGGYLYLQRNGVETATPTAATSPATPEPRETPVAQAAETPTVAPATEAPTPIPEEDFYKKGKAYLEGEGVAKDLQQAREYFRKAMEAGDRRGAVGLGLLYATGKGVTQDYAEAHRLFRKACESGSAQGCYNLAGTLAKGLGTPRDLSAALTSYERACELGSAKGCYKAGMYHLTGKGSSADALQARPFLEKSCEKGNAKGCTALGVALVKGGEHFLEAARAFEKACEAGNGRGCYNLGRLYEKGQGVERDSEKARSYYRQACEKGYQRGCRKQGLSRAERLETLQALKKKIDGDKRLIETNYARTSENGRLVRVENDLWPESVSMAYTISREPGGRIVKIEESPFSESGDWNIVNTSYFDPEGKLFAMERYLAAFNSEGCGANILKKIETDYYADGRKLESRTRLLDENDREIHADGCSTPVKNDRYTFATTLDGYLKKIGLASG
jgi:serine/threonine protein kinase